MYISWWLILRPGGGGASFVFCKYLKNVDGFSDKIIHKASRFYKTLYEQNPLEKFSIIFHHLPKLYFGFKETK